MEVKRYRVTACPDGVQYTRSVVEVSRREDGWVEIRHVRGQAPECAILAALMLRLGLVELAQPKADFPHGTYQSLEVKAPGALIGKRIGFTSRKGSSGAFWGHCWEVDENNWRVRPLAFWHESMYGRMNQAVWGYAAVLFAYYACGTPGAGLYLVRPDKLLIEEEKPIQEIFVDIVGDSIVTADFYCPDEPEVKAEPGDSACGASASGCIRETGVSAGAEGKE